VGIRNKTGVINVNVTTSTIQFEARGGKEFGFALIITNFRYFRGFGWFLLRLFEMQSLLT